MKKFTVVETEIIEKVDNEDAPRKLNYADLVRLCLNRTPQGGFSATEMEERLTVIRLFKGKKKGDVVELESAEIKKLKECVASMTWGKPEEDILEFVKVVEKL